MCLMFNAYWYILLDGNFENGKRLKVFFFIVPVLIPADILMAVRMGRG